MDTNFKVIDAMTKNPVTITSDISVKKCAELMSEHDVGSLLVIENKKVLGIITEQDLVRRVLAEAKNPEEVKASNILTRCIASISPNEDLFSGINLMAQLDIRHLPVLDGEDFVGFLTSKDILKVEPALFEIMIDSFEIKNEPHKAFNLDEEDLESRYYGETYDEEE